MAEKLPVIIDNCEDEPANRMITATTVGRERLRQNEVCDVVIELTESKVQRNRYVQYTELIF